MKKLLVVVLLLISSSSAFAISSNFNIDSSVDKSLTGAAILRLKVQDAQPKSGVCPYYVKSQQYLPALHVLSVEFFQETCVNEAYGQSKGELDWAVPSSLLANGQEIQLLVNQSKTGVLVYDESGQSFHLK